jgi:replicative DNA helicase
MASLDEGARKVPPHSIEAEESVIGGVLLDNNALDRALEILVPDDFYREAHRKIMRAIVDLNTRNEPVDLVTLTDALRSRDELQDVGGAAYLAELAERVPTAANVAYYARIIKDKAVLRSLIQRATEIAMRSYEAQADVDSFLDEAEHQIYEIAERKTRPSFFRVGDIVIESMKAVEQLYERKELVTGVPTGFIDLDRKTAGLQASDLIISTRPSSTGSASPSFRWRCPRSSWCCACCAPKRAWTSRRCAAATPGNETIPSLPSLPSGSPRPRSTSTTRQP